MSHIEVKNLQSCHWVMYLRNWKHQFGVFGFHHSHSKFLSLSDENKIRKSSQTKKIVWVPCFLITQLWVLDYITQKYAKNFHKSLDIFPIKIAKRTNGLFPISIRFTKIKFVIPKFLFQFIKYSHKFQSTI